MKLNNIDKTKQIIVICFVFVSMLKLNLCFAQWEYFGGVPAYPEITSMGTDGHVVLLSLYQNHTTPAFYRSSDKGHSWEPIVVQPHAFGNTKNITFFGNMVLAGGDSRFVANNFSILRSEDAGLTWESVGQVIKDTIQSPFGATIKSGTVHNFLKIEGKIIGGTNNGLVQSTDDGKTWDYVRNGINPKTIVYQFAEMDGKLFAATSNGLYTSEDNGDSWELLEQENVQNTQIGSLIKVKNNLIADGFISKDKGKS